jgi:hypothetical protein
MNIGFPLAIQILAGIYKKLQKEIASKWRGRKKQIIKTPRRSRRRSFVDME